MSQRTDVQKDWHKSMRQTNGGRLLLLLISRDVQSARQLSTTAVISLTETLRELDRLIDQGFIIATVDDASHPVVYHLSPKDRRTKVVDPKQRILLVDDDPALNTLMVRLLEGDGYAIIAVTVPVDAATLLNEIRFDLVLTDAYSRTPSGALLGTAEILLAAGTTPVALFTAHKLELEATRAAGFRDLIEKPFDIDEFGEHVRALLAEAGQRQ
jgi:CheY-like chemotaxis protein